MMAELMGAILNTLTDEELGSFIEALSSRSAQENGPELEALGFKAAEEWRRRHPNKLPPHIERRRLNGTLPPCFRH